MLVTFGGSSFAIPARDYPDSPITANEIDGGDYLRTQAGSLYNPVKYSFDQFTFSFTGITAATLNKFKTEIAVYSGDICISDSVWGTVNAFIVPGSFSYAYNTLDNHTMTFKIEERGY